MNQKTITLRFLAEPTEVNFGGKVHGGSVMKWIDQAGYAGAVGWSGKYCVTVYVGGIRFMEPVFIGNVVEVRARLIFTGTSSMHFSIDVFSRDPKSEDFRHNTHCIIVFVAVDANGKPIPIQTYTPETETEEQLWDYAQKLMNLRKGIEEEMEAYI